MKNLLAALLLALLVIGCDRSSPVDASASTATQSEAVFSETSMLKAVLPTGSIADVVADTGVRPPHDSLRNVYMLDSLKAYLGLTDEQFTQLQGFGATLQTTLADIKTQVDAKTITRDSAKVLVGLARATFVDSVKSILTADQLTSFETWLTKYWDRKPIRGVPGGHGGHGGPGGRGHGGPGGHGPGRP